MTMAIHIPEPRMVGGWGHALPGSLGHSAMLQCRAAATAEAAAARRSLEPSCETSLAMLSDLDGSRGRPKRKRPDDSAVRVTPAAFIAVHHTSPWGLCNYLGIVAAVILPCFGRRRTTACLKGSRKTAV